VLRLLDRSGAELARAETAAASRLHLAETQSGLVLASAIPARELAVLELDSLRLLHEEPGLEWRPPDPWLGARRDRPISDQLLVAAVGEGPRPNSAVLRYDTRTGERTLVAGRVPR
jgi:hypothetical protein